MTNTRCGEAFLCLLSTDSFCQVRFCPCCFKLLWIMFMRKPRKFEWMCITKAGFIFNILVINKN